jgi:hypothetical protein
MTRGYLALSCTTDASGSRLMYVSSDLEPDTRLDSVLFLNTIREEPKDLMRQAKLAYDLSLDLIVRT